MNKELLERYANLKNLIRDAEAQIKEIQPEVLEIMGDNEELSTDFGTFTIGHRRTYKYPESIVEAEEKLKAAKKEVEQTGIGCSYTENPYLIFKGVKE
jgi:hypothetical protein